MPESIDTKKAERRQLRFESIDDCLTEINRIGEAAEQGTLTTFGNWTAGQVLAHVAAWIEYGYEGYPIKPPPFFVRWFLRLQLKSILKKGVPAGVRIPGVKNGTTGQDGMEIPAALDRVRAALDRLTKEDGTHDSPAFGKMDHGDRILLNLRHAELHLSFLSYD